MARLTADAFNHYLSLGSDRSYDAVAKHYSCSKRSVSRRAQKEDWAGRIAQIEAEALEKTRKKQVESIEARTDRHLKILRLIEAKALETLRTQAIGSSAEAVRALDLVLKHEREILGLRGQSEEPPPPATKIVVMTPEEYSETRERLRSWWLSNCSASSDADAVIEAPGSTAKTIPPDRGR